MTFLYSRVMKRFIFHAVLATGLPVVLLAASHAEETVEEIILIKPQHTMPTTTGDATSLLGDQGVNFSAAGGISQLPSIRGMNGDRVKVLIDGGEITSACANHMNPPLSYMDASRISSTTVLSGITPVSMGGDSIAGTISVDSRKPAYSDSDELLMQGSIGAIYESNGRHHGEYLNATIANSNLSLGYSGSLDRSDSYRDGSGDKVLDTLYRSENHAITFGARGEVQELILKLTHQKVHYQGFPNQYMDMVGNEGDGVIVNYLHDFSWMKLDVLFSWNDVEHEMGFFTEEKTGTMPMYTEGKDMGYVLKAEFPLSEQHTLRIGNEYHKFELDDWWPAVPGSMMMGPDDYININDGERTRYALWAESDYRINTSWTALYGIRYEHVITDTDDVQPYNTMPMIMMSPNLDAPAATAFNARNHKQVDDNIDLTLLLRYQPTSEDTVEFGYARKTRSPNLYERYTWGRNTMAMTMIGWYGDGNGYVGDIDLDPETAHTLSAAYSKKASDSRWEYTISPYYTYVDDFIDATQIGTFNPRMVMSVTRPRLQFTNIDAEFYGLDVNGSRLLSQSGKWGTVNLKARASYTRGKRKDGPEDLYHIMPLNVKIALEQSFQQWANTIELEWVDEKDNVDQVRLENKTAKYTLLNIFTQYRWHNTTLNFGVRNLLDESHDLPLGGVNLAQWRDDGMMSPFESLHGPGRSAEMGIRYDF